MSKVKYSARAFVDVLKRDDSSLSVTLSAVFDWHPCRSAMECQALRQMYLTSRRALSASVALEHRIAFGLAGRVCGLAARRLPTNVGGGQDPI